MPVVPTPPTISPGIVTSSQLSQFRDAVRFLQSPPRFELRQTVQQPISNSTDTAVTFGSEDMDTDLSNLGGHSGSSSQWVAQYPGVYQLSGRVNLLANATGIRIAWIRVNGSDLAGTATVVSGTTAYDPAISTTPRKVFLNAADQVELFVWQNSGGSLNTYVAIDRYQSTLSGLWVSVS